MGEKELGKALLDLDSHKLAGAPAAQELTWRILERDRRRIWWLTATTIGLWSVAVLLVLWMLVNFGLLFPLQAKLRDDAQLARLGMRPPELKARSGDAKKEAEPKDRLPAITPEMREDAQFKAQIIFQMITVGVTLSVGVLALAALSTVLLVLASRRATLRQINASLLEISKQLQELRPAAGG